MTKAQMTKKRAMELTRRTEAGGYFHRSGTESYMFCPDCQERITGEHNPWEKPFKAMREAMIKHLRFDCEATQD